MYFKKYAEHGGYTIRVNFTKKIEYREERVDDTRGITWGDTTASNVERSESFFVPECVNRLLEKGYSPNAIAIEIMTLRLIQFKKRLETAKKGVIIWNE